MTIFSALSALAAGTLFLVYGALMVAPAGPFHERKLTAGIVLLVLGGTGVASFGGAVAGALVGAVVGLVAGRGRPSCWDGCASAV